MNNEIFNNILVEKGDPKVHDIAVLLDELSNCLQSITGDSGRNSFSLSDLESPKSVFAVARNEEGIAIGCGCIRPISNEIAELKRMYSRHKSGGIGKKILHYLEDCARELGYRIIWLETRVINQKAINFYEANGYNRIDNYGKYIGNDKAVCFERKLR